MKPNVILCGFMGCGKSTVGRRLAARLSLSFVDMDTFIEETAHQTVRALFDAEGEDGFRRREYEACVALGQQEGLVIATGGGAVLRDGNVAALRRNGVLVWLRVTPQTVLCRLKDDTARPLLQRDDKEAAIAALLSERTPLYARAADVTVDADDSPDAVADAIIDRLTATGIL